MILIVPSSQTFKKLMQLRNIPDEEASIDRSPSPSPLEGLSVDVDLHAAEKLSNVASVAETLLDVVPRDEEMTEQPAVATTSKPLKNYRHDVRKEYANQLMNGEWLLEVPHDFADNWYMVPCPRGKRCFLAAENGQTSVYSKEGRRLFWFTSNLPGGNKTSRIGRTHLDAFYLFDTKTFYLLDVLCWNGSAVCDSETEFRFQWLDWKLAEISLPEHSQYHFVRLPVFCCTHEAIETALCSKSWPFPADKLSGLLFYHKQTHYYPGTTPLVGWLLPFMCQELLNVTVLQEYMTGFEDCSVAQYIEKWKEMLHK
ncbi:unnamed protein product [Soboliphyme baturini]|uniref:Snurportin-1 n=1 Tax=Soboliphyme baturini TaxID=241478 RepID=A0A183IJQ7_9BILA|nr:unnamed protein product [Soboliphyme baturini]